MKEYRRILLKISGEALGMTLLKQKDVNSKGFSIETVNFIASQIHDIHKTGTQVSIVLGGGNIFRGADLLASGITRNSADTIGMLSTIMNAVYFADVLRSKGVDTIIMTQNHMDRIADFYTVEKAKACLEQSKVVIYAGGLGMPYFSTDTVSAHRSIETGCDLMIKATKVDGIFESDPQKNPDAARIDNIDYKRIISDNLKVMDMSAILLCKENKLDLCVLDIFRSNSLLNAVTGKGQGTLVKG